MVQFTQVDGTNVGDIRFFALSTCGWCRKTKQFLDENKLAYSYVYVDLLPEDEIDEAATEQRQYNASGSFPTIVVDGNKVIVGYDTIALEQLANSPAHSTL